MNIIIFSGNGAYYTTLKGKKHQAGSAAKMPTSTKLKSTNLLRPLKRWNVLKTLMLYIILSEAGQPCRVYACLFFQRGCVTSWFSCMMMQSSLWKVLLKNELVGSELRAKYWIVTCILRATISSRRVSRGRVPMTSTSNVFWGFGFVMNCLCGQRTVLLATISWLWPMLAGDDLELFVFPLELCSRFWDPPISFWSDPPNIISTVVKWWFRWTFLQLRWSLKLSSSFPQ